MLLSAAHIFNERERTRDVITDEQLDFGALLLSNSTLRGLSSCGFLKPSPIQLKAIPLGKCGFDLIVKSKSGTGKTLVFAILALELINLNKNNLQVLIVVPAREIAIQIQSVLKDIGREYKGLCVESFIGGLPIDDDLKKLKQCHIAVGAPGRIKHLIELGALNMKTIRLFVMDEVDKLLESTLRQDIYEISKLLSPARQIITSSATFSQETYNYLEDLMASPTLVEPTTDTPLLLGLKQFAIVVKSNFNVVHQVNLKLKQIIRILSNVSFTQCLIFTNYQTRAESISNMLNAAGWQTNFISAAQKQSERLRMIDALKSGECRILLSTDVTSRGIDASNVDLVVNFDVPFITSTYLHRMGRAGRFGSRGVCITLPAENKELLEFQKILGSIGGVNFSVCRLPSDGDLPSNLLDLNTKNFDSVKGIIDNESLTKDIRNITESIAIFKRSKPAICEGTKKDRKNNSMSNELSNSSVDNIQDMLKNNNLNDSVDSQGDADMDLMLLLKAKAEDESPTKEISLIEDQTDNLISELNNTDVLSILNSTARNESAATINDCTITSYTNEIIPIEKLTKEVAVDTESVKKRKRKSHDRAVNVSTKGVSASSKDLDATLSKNLTLYNVTKLISNPNDKSAPDVTMIFEKSDAMKETEEADVAEAVDDDESSELVYQHVADEPGTMAANDVGEWIPVEAKEEAETDPKLENIFELAYNSATKPDEVHWTECLQQYFLTQEQRNKILMEGTGKELSQPDFLKQTYLFEKPSKRHKKSNRTGQQNNYNSDENKSRDENKIDESARSSATQQYDNNQAVNQNFYESGLYAEYDYRNYQQFTDYFKKCSDELTEKMETFEDVESFESWYPHWQFQVQSIREYIQQNVYLTEMNKFVYGANY